MMMARTQEAEEVKKWIELLNESKKVTDQKAVEFNLANAYSHEEYWIFLKVSKHTGSEQCKGNCGINLNGAWIGYYILSGDFSGDPNEETIHVWTEPLNLIEITGGSVSLKFNSTIIKRQENVGNETGTGKFMLNFPANYTGEVTARVLGR